MVSLDFLLRVSPGCSAGVCSHQGLDGVRTGSGVGRGAEEGVKIHFLAPLGGWNNSFPYGCSTKGHIFLLLLVRSALSSSRNSL